MKSQYFNLKYALIFIFLLKSGFNLQAQVYVSGSMAQPNTSGEYYNNNSITLSPGFSANGSIGTFHAFISETLPVPAVFSNDKNYINKWSPKTAIKTIQQLKNLEGSNNLVSIDIQYLDEFGRSIQTVEKSATSNGTDLIQPYEYDEQGRQIKAYLPYAADDGQSGSYRVNAISVEQPAFYNNITIGIPQSNTPYAKILIENSSLERVMEQGAPGDYWQLSNSGIPNSGHTEKYEYIENNGIAISDAINSRIAVKYNVNVDNNGNRTLALTSELYYNEADLFVKVIKDQNWNPDDGRAGTQEIYSNKDGQNILERSFIKNTSGGIEILSTYFVYDDFGNLSYVLSPGAIPDHPGTSGIVISPDMLNKFCYQYQYDEKQRLVAKRTPGRDWEYTIYNKSNAVVATQNGLSRTKNEWIIKKYDGLGRLIITGIWNNGNISISRDDLQSIVNEQTQLWEERTQNGVGYSVSAWPQTINKYYSINYYDDYSVPGLPSDYTYQYYAGNAAGKSDQITGNLTVVKTWPLSNSLTELWTVNYYNSDGKLIQGQSTNHLSGKDIFNREYNFDGQVTKTEHRHISSSQDILITNRFIYDHRGRLLQQFEKIANDPEILLSKLEYNKLGELIDKKLHQKNSSSRFLQSVDYRYNIAGQLISINDSSLAAISSQNTDDLNTSDNDKFGMVLNYDQASSPQYNGNIGSIQWQTALPTGISSGATTNKYDFYYDKLNRVTESVSSTGGIKSKYFDEYLSYDNMGNIKTLGRWSKLSTGRTQIDSLNYSYAGNQVDRIDDNTNNNTYGFTENVGGVNIKQGGEYGYDANGNLIKDLNKGITSITYNNFDLPEMVTFNDGKTVSYDYDGTGVKLKKVFNTGSTNLTTDYISEIQYEQGQLSFIVTEEGLARRNTSGNFVYQYALRDHLGNTRVMIQPIYPNEIDADLVQVSSYYPYGLEMKSDDPLAYTSYVNGDKNNYLFNDKEDQYPIGMYDFGARMYDPATGRWNAPDPADQFLHESPYAALGNNPIVYTDPDGRFIHIIIGAVVGGIVNLGVKAVQGKIHGFKDGIAAFGIGAVAGGIGAATGGASLAATGGLEAASIGGGALIGAVGGTVNNLIESIGNTAYFGDAPLNAKGLVTNAIIGGVTGGVLGGVANKLSRSGANLWTGKTPAATDPMIPISPQDIENATNSGNIVTIEGNAGNGINMEPRSLQHMFKHAKDFGITGNWNKATASEFESILRNQISEITPIQGTYRGVQDVLHYFNPNTSLNIMTSMSGKLIGGWKLSADQINYLLSTGAVK